MKTEIQNETDASVNSAPSASYALNLELAEVRKTRGLSKLVGFSERQFQIINEWLDEQVAYRKISEYCRTEWQRDVPHMTIARYAKRRMALTLAADLTDSKEAAAEISKYAATGDVSFSTNTLELLEQQAFDLAAVYQRDNDAADLDTLKKLTSIINRARNTRVRERHATVQEQKIQLRREELALKRELLARTPNLNRNLNPNLFTADGINNDNTAGAGPNATDPEIPSSSSASSAPSASSALKSESKAAHSPAVSTAENAPSDDDFDYENMPSISPNPLPPEVIARNLEFSRKLRAGKIIIDHSGPYVRAIRVSDIPAVDPSPAPQNTEAAPADSNPNP